MKNDPYIKLRQGLLKYQAENELHDETVAKALGLSVLSVRNFKRGETKPHRRTLEAVSKLLGEPWESDEPKNEDDAKTELTFKNATIRISIES